jgi:hypothetical protein
MKTLTVRLYDCETAGRKHREMLQDTVMVRMLKVQETKALLCFIHMHHLSKEWINGITPSIKGNSQQSAEAT